MGKFELHYYFCDETHSMNAFVRNKCEVEVLAIISEISEIMGVSIQVESEALAEGGLRNKWKILGDNSGAISVVIALSALAVSVYPHIDNENRNLEKEDLQLSIEERKHRLSLLKERIKSGGDFESLASDILNEDYKVTTRRSNFYKHLNHYPKVSKVGVIRRDIDDSLLGEERVIERRDFNKFVLKTNKLPPNIDDKAIIEIVSPVLKSGKYQWKGIYNGKVIPFSMSDHAFKASVIHGEMSFQNGTVIKCVLEEALKLDEIGDIKSTGYTVTTVISKDDNGEWLETKQGINYEYSKKQRNNQGELFE